MIKKIANLILFLNKSNNIIHLLKKLKYFINMRIINTFIDKFYYQTVINKSIEQNILKFFYKENLNKKKIFRFEEVGFNLFSSTNEDGILLYIYSIIGFTNKKCIDIGCGSIKGSNSANLIINHGFKGLLIDANKDIVRELKEFYESLPFCIAYQPCVLSEKVTMANINKIILENSFDGEIDLLAIDVDGIDYWILSAINIVKPRVILLEYQDALGPEKSLTIPYNENFNFRDYDVNKSDYNYMGASLNAFVKLLKSKGYKLIGCNSGGWNAFFILNDLGNESLKEIQPRDCFVYERNFYSVKNRYPLIKDLPWVEV